MFKNILKNVAEQAPLAGLKNAISTVSEIVQNATNDQDGSEETGISEFGFTSSSTSELHDLKMRLKRVEETAAEALVDLEDTRDRLAQEVKHVTRLRNALSAAEVERKSAEATWKEREEGLLASLQEKTDEVERLTQQMGALHAASQAMKAKGQKQYNLLMNVRAENEKLKQQLEELAVAKNGDDTADIRNSSRTNDHGEENANTQTMSDDDLEELKRCRLKLIDVQSKLDLCHMELDSKSLEVERIKIDLKRATEDLAALEKKGENDILLMERKMEAEISLRTQKKDEELEELKLRKNEEISLLEASILATKEQAAQRIAEIEREVDKKVEEFSEEAEKRVLVLEEAKTKAEAKVAATKMEVLKLLAEEAETAEATKAELALAKEEASTAKAEVDSLEAELATVKLDRDEKALLVHRRVQDLESELDSLSAKLSQKDAEAQLVESQLWELRRAVEASKMCSAEMTQPKRSEAAGGGGVDRKGEESDKEGEKEREKREKEREEEEERKEEEGEKEERRKEENEEEREKKEENENGNEEEREGNEEEKREEEKQTQKKEDVIEVKELLKWSHRLEEAMAAIEAAQAKQGAETSSIFDYIASLQQTAPTSTASASFDPPSPQPPPPLSPISPPQAFSLDPILQEIQATSSSLVEDTHHSAHFALDITVQLQKVLLFLQTTGAEEKDVERGATTHVENAEENPSSASSSSMVEEGLRHRIAELEAEATDLVTRYDSTITSYQNELQTLADERRTEKDFFESQILDLESRIARLDLDLATLAAEKAAVEQRLTDEVEAVQLAAEKEVAVGKRMADLKIVMERQESELAGLRVLLECAAADSQALKDTCDRRVEEARAMAAEEVRTARDEAGERAREAQLESFRPLLQAAAEDLAVARKEVERLTDALAAAELGMERQRERVEEEMRKGHEAEVAKLNGRYEDRLSALREEHEKTVGKLKMDLDARLASINEKHASEMARVCREYESKIAAVEGDFGRKSDAIEAGFRTQIESLKAEYENRILALSNEHEKQTALMQKRLDEKLFLLEEEHVTKMQGMKEDQDRKLDEERKGRQREVEAATQLLRDRILILESSRDALNDSIVAAQREAANLRVALEQAREELRKDRGEAEREREDLVRMKEEAAERSRKFQIVQMRFKADQEEARHRLDRAEATAAAATAAVEAAEARCQEQVLKLQEMEVTLEATSSDLAAVNSLKVMAEVKLRAVDAKLVELAAEHTALQLRYRELEQKKESLTAALSAETLATTTASAGITRSDPPTTAAVESLQSDLSNARSACEAAEKLLEQERTERQKESLNFQATAEELRIRIRELETRIQEMSQQRGAQPIGGLGHGEQESQDRDPSQSTAVISKTAALEAQVAAAEMAAAEQAKKTELIEQKLSGTKLELEHAQRQVRELTWQIKVAFGGSLNNSSFSSQGPSATPPVSRQPATISSADPGFSTGTVHIGGQLSNNFLDLLGCGAGFKRPGKG